MEFVELSSLNLVHQPKKIYFSATPKLNKSTFYCMSIPKFSKYWKKMAESLIFFSILASELNFLPPLAIVSSAFIPPPL